MKTSRPIVIVGGGLAGLSLGILLRQREIPAVVYEAGSYPRHRVCGEFISGRGLAVLELMGVRRRLERRGARKAVTALFASPRASSGALPLPEPGLCVSRFDLDRELRAVFREAGGDLREGERWNGQWGADGVVRATGRRVAANPGAGRFIGLKAHALGAALEADVEVHLVPGGYVGICRLDEEKVNVCGLFRRRPAAADLAGRWREWLAGSAGSFLRRRLESATFAGETFCAVAGLDLRPRSAAGAGECAIGDSLTMIAPVAGNGMSLAFESAALAARELEGYSRGETSWETARGAVATGCDARFAARLRWARAAHLGLLALPIGDLMARCVSWAPGLWPFLFARTR